MLAPDENTRSLALVTTTVRDLGMLEADAVQRVVELDVDAEVVAVEFQLVAGPEAAVLVEIGDERRHRAVEFQLPVAVAVRRGLVVDRVGTAHAALLDRQFSAFPGSDYNAL